MALTFGQKNKRLDFDIRFEFIILKKTNVNTSVNNDICLKSQFKPFSKSMFMLKNEKKHYSNHCVLNAYIKTRLVTVSHLIVKT